MEYYARLGNPLTQELQPMDKDFDAVVELAREAVNVKFDEMVAEIVDEAADAVAALISEMNEPDATPKKFLGAARSLWVASGASAAVGAAIATFAPNLAGLLP